jgi:hypothetical protein
MQLNGTIQNIVPDGGYQSQNGYINTFQMSVNTPTGLFTGQIGSKSQIYPLAIGQPILVEMTETQNGVRFKKVNPKFANQAPQGQPQQVYVPVSQPQQPVRQTTLRPAVQSDPTRDSIEKQTCLKAAVEYNAHSPIGEGTVDDIIHAAKRFYIEFLSAKKIEDMSNDELLSQPASVDDIPY